MSLGLGSFIPFLSAYISWAISVFIISLTITQILLSSNFIFVYKLTFLAANLTVQNSYTNYNLYHFEIKMCKIDNYFQATEFEAP